MKELSKKTVYLVRADYVSKSPNTLYPLSGYVSKSSGGSTTDFEVSFRLNAETFETPEKAIEFKSKVSNYWTLKGYELTVVAEQTTETMVEIEHPVQCIQYHYYQWSGPDYNVGYYQFDPTAGSKYWREVDKVDYNTLKEKYPTATFDCPYP